MATVNKNFRVKNGLVVEGNSATVGGYDVLTKNSADQSYIVNLIGGTATSANEANKVVKRDGSGNFSAGTITADLIGDVTGTVSSLANHTTDDLTEGSNLYYTAARAKAEAANLLTNATKTNIVITKDGSNNLTITAENGVADSTTDDLAEGSAHLYFTNTRARLAISGGTGISYDNTTGVVSVDNTIATKTYADNAANDAESAANNYTDNKISTEVTDRNNAISSAISTEVTNRNNAITNAINDLTTDDIEEGSNNKYFTNSRVRNAVSGGTGLDYNQATGEFSVTAGTYDTYGAASNAEASANTYTDNQINALTTSDIEEGSNLYFTDERAQDAIGNNLGNGLSYNDSTGEISVDTSVIANKSYVDTKVADLVDSAPALLDTLNELAAAIGDDANFVNTVTTGLSEKVAKSGDTMTGALTLSADPVNNLHAATKQYVDNSTSSAQSSAESTAQGYVNDLANGATSFTAVNVNDVSRQIAATTGNIANAGIVTALSWNKNSYRTAKVLVKAKNGSHTHVSEVLITLDTSDNIAVNEYAITTTNGSLMDISADININDVRVRVTTANNNTEVLAHATLLV